MRPIPIRQVLTPSDITRRFDADLLDPALTDQELVRGCEQATELGLASVVCRLPRVAMAARAVAGSNLTVCTGLNVRDGGWFDASPRQLSAAADQAVDDGAQDLAMFVPPTQLEDDAVEALTERIVAVVTAARACGGMARIVMSTAGMTPDQIRRGCQLSTRCGAHMVQGGSVMTQDRASISQITLMRRHLPRPVLLGWMATVRSLDRFLVAHAEGVDRFWGDAETVLAQARDRQSWGETIQVPLLGVDF
jgi:deoxyribose-phosphate aldolase